jgi:hypothetical protein
MVRPVRQAHLRASLSKTRSWSAPLGTTEPAGPASVCSGAGEDRTSSGLAPNRHIGRVRGPRRPRSCMWVQPQTACASPVACIRLSGQGAQPPGTSNSGAQQRKAEQLGARSNLGHPLWAVDRAATTVAGPVPLLGAAGVPGRIGPLLMEG